MARQRRQRVLYVSRIAVLTTAVFPTSTPQLELALGYRGLEGVSELQQSSGAHIFVDHQAPGEIMLVMQGHPHSVRLCQSLISVRARSRGGGGGWGRGMAPAAALERLGGVACCTRSHRTRSSFLEPRRATLARTRERDAPSRGIR